MGVVITACVVASVVVNFHGEATVNGKTFGPNESVVTQCAMEKVTVDDLVKRDVSEAKALTDKIKERKQEP
jgi:hypothetical protein